MRKLNEKQKDMIKTRFVYAYLGVKTYAKANAVIAYTEKFGNETNNLEEDINRAEEIAIEKAQ